LLIDDTTTPSSFLYYMPRALARLVKYFNHGFCEDLNGLSRLLNVIQRFKPARDVCTLIDKSRLLSILTSSALDLEHIDTSAVSHEADLHDLCDMELLRLSKGLFSVREEDGCTNLVVRACGFDLKLRPHVLSYQKLLVLDNSPISQLMSLCTTCEVMGPPDGAERISGDDVIKVGDTLIVGLSNRTNVAGAFWLGERYGSETVALIASEGRPLRSFLKVLDESNAVIDRTATVSSQVILLRKSPSGFEEIDKTTIESFLKRNLGLAIQNIEKTNMKSIIKPTEKLYLIGNDSGRLSDVLKDLGYDVLSLSYPITEDYLVPVYG